MFYYCEAPLDYYTNQSSVTLSFDYYAYPTSLNIRTIVNYDLIYANNTECIKNCT